MHFTDIELNKLQNPEIFEHVELDITPNIKTLRHRNLQWVWIQDVLSNLPAKKCIFLALPDGKTPSEFALLVRTMLSIAWKETRNSKWSVRQSERRDGVYVLKAIELPPLHTLEDRLKFWGISQSCHPKPLTSGVKRKARELAVSLST